MRLGVRDLAAVEHVEFRHRDRLNGSPITGVSTDSRTVKEGDLFVALHGENFDGHRFLRDAVTKGAVAVVIQAGRDRDAPGAVPMLIVNDTVKALGILARNYRRRFIFPVLAIGGSNGKTTTKDMTARVLAMKFRTLATEGNLNNHIGVPQTIFRMEKRHDIAVVEIGTNHPGEVEYLCGILEPTHGLLTNVGHEHLEFFKSLEGVAEEEGELFMYLRNAKGFAFVNADDRYVVAASRGMQKKVSYGFEGPRVQVRGRMRSLTDKGCAVIEFKRHSARRAERIELSLPGRHNALNALAAAAVGLAFRVGSGNIRKALEGFQATSRRMEVLNVGGIVLLNDAYNANPDSMSAALQTLAEARVSGKRIAVLGDMLELGERSSDEHTRIGEMIAGLGIDYLLTFGTEARRIQQSAHTAFSAHYDQKNVLAEYLAELVVPGDAVLVKGSRGMHMEDIVAFVQARKGSPADAAPRSRAGG